MQLNPDDVEPEKTPFPGYDVESVLMPTLRLAPAPTIEEWALMLWGKIRRAVGSTGFGPGQITWADLVAFEKFEQIQLSRFMVNLILLVDNAFLGNWKPHGEKKPA